MSRIPVPQARFKVYPHPPSKWRFEICVFRTQAEMYGYGLRVWSHDSTNYHAICLSLATEELVKSRSRKLGEILFTVNGLTHGLIAHEMIHAGQHYLQVICGRDVVIINSCGESHITEETVAHAVAGMVTQMSAELARREIAIHD